MGKVLIIGLDSAGFDLMRPWLAEGRLPNLAAFLKKSCRGPLASTIPHMTFPAWATFMTGKNPGKHRIYDCQGYDPSRYAVYFTNASHRRAETMWKMMSDAGKRVAVLYMPVTYPPEKINGVMISGWDMPMFGIRSDKSFFHPPGLAGELMQQGCDNVSFPDVIQDLRQGRVSRVESRIIESLDARKNATSYLLKKGEWDCFAVVFSDTDVVSHYFWQYHDPHSPYFDREGRQTYGDLILKVYQRIDKVLGEILEQVPPGTLVILMSDHGFGGSSDKIIDLNRFLEEEGVFFRKPEGQKGVGRSALDAAKRLSIRFLPGQVKSMLFRSSLVKTGKLMSMLRFGSYDWGRTLAYATGQPTMPGVWVNLRGREPNGRVEPGKEYEQLRDRLIQRLESLSDPEDGHRVVRKAYRREEVYDGPYVTLAPDLVIQYNLDAKGYAYVTLSASVQVEEKKPVTRLNGETLRSMLAEWPSMAGSHRENGIFALSGPGSKAAQAVSAQVHISDLAPTILYYMGLPIPKSVDGRVCFEVFEPEYIQKNHACYIDDGKKKPDLVEGLDYTEAEEEKMHEKLKGLGYMD